MSSVPPAHRLGAWVKNWPGVPLDVMLAGVQAVRARVLLADDHPDVLGGLVRTLEPHVDVVGTAENGQDAVEKTASLTPDVLVLDVFMPRMNGFEAAEKLRLGGRAPIIIFISAHEEPCLVKKALNVGAAAYIFKRRVARDLAKAIFEVLAGRIFVSSQ